MKKLQHLVLLLAFALMGYSSGLHAEDTDLYVANAINKGTPNVLIVIDNGADFSANASIGCSGYLDGTGAPSTGTSTTSGVLQCALVNAIQSLQDKAVNIGIMVSNANNFAETQATTDQSKGGYHEKCASGGNGGCLLRPLTLMDDATGGDGKAKLIKFIKGWKTTSQSDADGFVIKVNSSYQAETMQEAWAYFSGKTGMSGTAYSPSILAGCQGNAIIYISNTQKKPNSNESGPAYTALSASQVGATSDQLAGITGSIQFTPPICGGSGASTLYTLTTGNNWADEWARLLNQVNAGAQNVTTYTIGIESSGSQCSQDTFGLIASMANVGGGEFFRVSSVNDLSDAINKILNQAQAVNSVFSSASLPVSVNADGSYLNQIYLGMFRPDVTGAPRWLGNLKQYHLIKNAAGALVQGDAQTPPQSAINPKTGFISPTSVSFWTKKDTSALPDSTGGFWKNATASQGTLKSPYDSPDGEVVEKGGVSQQLRLESITADFSATAQTSSNPRRMYVYCPDGSATCPKDLTAATNQFSTSNSTIPSNAFGSDSVVPINSIVRSGTTALVVTSGNHGFKSGTTVTISGATQPEYNVSQTLTSSTVNSSTTFTITGLPDYPTSPSQGTYTIGPPGGTTTNIVSMSRSTSTTGGNPSETVTVTTDVAHGFTTASSIQIAGASPSVYNYWGTPKSASGTTLTFDVAITPATPSANGYVIQLSPTVYTARSVNLTNPATGEIDGTTLNAHGLHAGQQVIITGGTSNSKYAGTYTVASVPTTTTFTITTAGNGVKNLSGESGTVKPDSTTKSIAVGAITRAASTDSASATVTGLPASWFGAALGDTAVVNVSQSSGSATNESAYLANAVTATCANAGCTTLTYPITVSPSSNIVLNSATVAPQTAGTAVLSAGKIQRSGTAVTVSGPFVDQNGASVTFTNGQVLAIAATGTALNSEAGYLGTWRIACSSCSSSFTLTRTDGSTVQLTPSTPATGSITAYAAGTPPDRDTLIRWVRGEDNFGGEKGPGGTITVRPSIHGDVLHSRPVVINYGDTRGIVVFYGANDGVYRAVNGNQTTGNINGVPPGGELWGLILPEHFTKYNRVRQDSPEVKFPSTTLASARPKDYFVDGQTAAYQLTKTDGTIDKAYLFITMRRGGRFMYALDVTDPVTPKVMWKISSSDTGFGELGQTWSRPRTTLVQGGGRGLNPVLVFGAGYDSAEDSQPPGTDTMGRGIFIVDAVTGTLVWSASSSCGTSTATCLNVPGMQWAIPSDMAFVDRDGDGVTDKIYFGDMGGNLWRADVAAATTDKWTVTRIGALGCDEGAPSTSTHLCTNGTAPRKFFFPPSVLPVKTAGSTGSFDAISIPSGDREHPLKEVTPATSAYNVTNRFFMINDRGTQVLTQTGTSLVSPPTQDVTQASLFNASSSPYDANAAALKPTGFYITFTTGEKGVNAPLATNGLVFFATNQPKNEDSTCGANLGTAIAYAVSPFLGTASSNLIIGGGLPPGAVAGLINITTTDDKGNSTTSQERFCIGCAANCTTCSALENSPPANTIPKNIKRTYWYKK